MVNFNVDQKMLKNQNIIDVVFLKPFKFVKMLIIRCFLRTVQNNLAPENKEMCNRLQLTQILI